MNTFVLGYLLFILTQIIRETMFRKGKEAKNIHFGIYDKGTTILSSIYITAICFFPLFLSYFNQGFVLYNKFIGFVGILIMLLGMSIHFIAIKTLGELFTRTLTITKKHFLLRTGIYCKIRHPGYLGTILVGIGFGLASYNWLLMLTILALLLIAYSFRINSEEKMLKKQFGKEYEEYKKNSWALIPYIL